jgi:hypothetical protein
MLSCGGATYSRCGLVWIRWVHQSHRCQKHNSSMGSQHWAGGCLVYMCRPAVLQYVSAYSILRLQSCNWEQPHASWREWSHLEACFTPCCVLPAWSSAVREDPLLSLAPPRAATLEPISVALAGAAGRTAAVEERLHYLETRLMSAERTSSEVRLVQKIAPHFIAAHPSPHRWSAWGLPRKTQGMHSSIPQPQNSVLDCGTRH